jgi:acetyl-CoA carboxylase alpha subunit
VIEAVGDALERALEPLQGLSGAELRHKRRQKFLGMGQAGAL